MWAACGLCLRLGLCTRSLQATAPGAAQIVSGMPVSACQWLSVHVSGCQWLQHSSAAEAPYGLHQHHAPKRLAGTLMPLPP
jgi:hypothetical protein